MPNGHLQHTRGGYGFAYAARNAEDTVKCDLVGVEARNIEVGQYRVSLKKSESFSTATPCPKQNVNSISSSSNPNPHDPVQVKNQLRCSRMTKS